MGKFFIFTIGFFIRGENQMDIQPLSSTSGNEQTASTSGTANTSNSPASTKPTPPKDRVELSNRNPANKKELMATYGKIRAEQPASYRASILQSITGKNVNYTPVQNVQLQSSSVTDYTAEAMTALAKKSVSVTPDQGNVVSGKNTLTNTDRLSLSVQGGTAVAPNTITGPKGAANSNNEVVVSGAGNNVNLAGTSAAGVRQETFELTGGPGIDNTMVAIEGNNNSVSYTGGLQQNNNIALQGNNNSVSVANGVSDASVSVQGNNVSVDFGADNVLTKNQSGWALNVNASNLSISIKNGEATVSGNTEGLQIQIDNVARTVTIG
jgi:hypothetical protein